MKSFRSLWLVVGALCILSTQIPAAEAAVGRLTEYTLPANTKGYASPSSTYPRGIAAGPDGNTWFTEFDTNKYANSIGQITPAGAVNLFHIPTKAAAAEEIIAGPAGSNQMWFYERHGNKIGRIDVVTHGFTEVRIPSAHSADGPNWNVPAGITVGPDAAIWFSEVNNDKIGRLDPATGRIKEFPVPCCGVGDLHTGPDGNLWYTAGGIGSEFVNRIGRFNPSTHAVTEYALPTAVNRPQYLAAGPDGRMWFTEARLTVGTATDKIGRLDPSTGAIVEFAIPAHGDNNPQRDTEARPEGIAAGPDGNLWFTEQDAGRIGRITTSGVLTEYLVPYQGVTGGGSFPAAEPLGITRGPDGAMWFTELRDNQIGRLAVA